MKHKLRPPLSGPSQSAEIPEVIPEQLVVE